MIVNGSEVRVILLGDEFIGDSFLVDALSGTIDKIVDDAPGDEIADTLVDVAVGDK